MKTRLLQNTKETQEFAQEIAQEILKTPKNNKAFVLGLIGELGAGKTTFTQSLAKALNIKRRVLSPTFLIMKRFPLPKTIKFENLYHIDAYRIGKADLQELGIADILSHHNIVVVEWADRVKSILPKDTVWLRFKHGQREDERKVTINRR